MAQLANTHDRYDLATTGENAREALSDIITNISPSKTPFQSNIGRADVSSTFFEWLEDSLAAPVDNARIDGDEFSADALDGAERMGNYAQISSKQLAITRRAEKVQKAGRKSEMAMQLAKKGKELKNDIERALVGVNQAAVAGNSTTASRSASVSAFMRTNVSRGASGANPTLSSSTYGFPNAAATDGTLRALSEATMLSVLGSIEDAGGDPDMIMMSTTVKQKFSQYMFSSSARIATPNQQISEDRTSGLTAIGAVDVYVSDFGTMEVVPNLRMRSRDVLLIDRSKWELAIFDDYHVEEMGKTGDAEKKMLIMDWGLKCLSQAASGIIADIDATAAMTA